MKNAVEIVQSAITNPATPWVLFSQGTVVFLPGQTEKLESLATELLREWGPVKAGSPAGDFRVISMDRGWFVGGHHNDILTLVTPDELEADSPSDVEVGVFGRTKRDADAQSLQVIHVQAPAEGSAPPEPEMDWSTNPVLKKAQKLLHQGDPRAMTEYLLAGDPGMTLEMEGAGATVYRETKLPTFLEEPWASLYLKAAPMSLDSVTRQGPRGFEVRVRGPLYYLTSETIEEIDADILVTGIDGNGKMKGAAPQAILKKFGAEVELAAQEELAKTDRSLGTMVTTVRPQKPRYKNADFLGHVVSTPKYTPESPGWLTRAVANILDDATELPFRSVAVVALGTSGGIAADVAARLMLNSCQEWFENKPLAMKVIFSLPARPVREAFEAEFRRQKVYFT